MGCLPQLYLFSVLNHGGQQSLKCSLVAAAAAAAQDLADVGAEATEKAPAMPEERPPIKEIKEIKACWGGDRGSKHTFGSHHVLLDGDVLAHARSASRGFLSGRPKASW